MWSLLVILTLGIGLFGGVAHAQNNSAPSAPAASSAPVDIANPGGVSTAGIFDTFISNFEQQMVGWASGMTTAANRLFMMFAAIGLAWLAFDRFLFNPSGDASVILQELLKFTLITGIFLWALNNAASLATVIMKSFELLGSTTGNGITSGGGYGASDLMARGIKVMALILSVAVGNFFSGSLASFVLIVIFAIFVSAIIFFICLFMAIEVILAWVEMYAVAYGGIIFLSFGGLQQTREKAMGYWWKVVGSGAHLMGVLLCVNLFFTTSETTLSKMTAAAAGPLGALANVSNGNYLSAVGQFLFSSTTTPMTLVAYMLQYVIECAICLVVMKRLPQQLASLAGGASAQGSAAMQAAVGAFLGAKGGGAGGGGRNSPATKGDIQDLVKSLAAGAGGGPGGMMAAAGAAAQASGAGMGGGPMISDAALSGSGASSGGGASGGGDATGSSSDGIGSAGGGGQSGGGASGSSTDRKGGGVAAARAAMGSANAALAKKAVGHALMAPFHLANALHDGKIPDLGLGQAWNDRKAAVADLAAAEEKEGGTSDGGGRS
jgi:type IV secretion system protein VirB6/type IV secretion system protein TrbL